MSEEIGYPKLDVSSSLSPFACPENGGYTASFLDRPKKTVVSHLATNDAILSQFVYMISLYIDTVLVR